MHIADHKKLENQSMICPMLPFDRDGRPRQCIGERCALWYKASNHDYSGCSVFITAFYTSSVSYHVSNGGMLSRDRSPDAK